MDVNMIMKNQNSFFAGKYFGVVRYWCFMTSNFACKAYYTNGAHPFLYHSPLGRIYRKLRWGLTGFPLPRNKGKTTAIKRFNCIVLGNVIYQFVISFGD